jgi:hypothetical protein
MFLLSSCNFPVPQNSIASSGKLYTWIDAPLNESRLPLSPYEIVLHANAASGIAEVTLFINDESFETFPVSQTATFMTTIRQVWQPRQPGIYKIYAQVRDLNGEIGNGESVQVEIVMAESTPTVLTLTTTPSITPTFTPSITPTPAPLLVSVSAGPSQAYIGNCGADQIQFMAQVSNPEQIRSLILFVKLREINGTYQTDWNNGYSMTLSTAAGNFVYNLQTSLIPGNAQFKEASLLYQFLGYDAKGQIIDRSPVYDDLQISQCIFILPMLTLNPGFPPRLTLPSSTPTIGVK